MSQQIGSRTFSYRFGEAEAARFLVAGDRVALVRLYGLPCGLCERDAGPELARGLVTLRTSRGVFGGATLRAAEARFDEQEAEVLWRTPDGGLCVNSRWRLCPNTGIWSRADRVENHAYEPLVIDALAARFVFSPDRYRVYSQASRWCGENQGRWRDVDHGDLVLYSEEGRTAQGSAPVLRLCRVEDGAGLAFHVLPRGNWMIRVRTRTAGGESLPFVIVELGPRDEHLRLTLPPGASYELPEILCHRVSPGPRWHEASCLHAYALAHHLTAAKETVPVVYNTWFDAFEELDVERLHRQLEAAVALGCEVFTVDAGWYGRGSGNWSAQTGDWREKEKAAFDGHMADFAGQVRRAGLGFGLWMEPERIGPDAPILREHPDWFLPATAGYHRPDLENPTAYGYLDDEISRLIETYELAWIKLDFNLNLGEDVSGAEFSGYYQALYRLLDGLRERYADTFFEGCASGGMRLDLEALSHFDGHFMSDTVNPVDALRIYQGALLRLPPGRLGKWVVLRAVGSAVPEYGVPLASAPSRVVTPTGATWERSVTTDVDFAAGVCLPGMFGLSGDVAGLPTEVRDRLRAHVDRFKTWRGLTVNSLAHTLTPPRPIEDRSGWVAIQLRDPSRTAGLLFVYRLDDACDRRTFHPRELGDGLWSVRDLDMPEHPVMRRPGAEVMREGIAVSLADRFSAAVLSLQREADGEQP